MKFAEIAQTLTLFVCKVARRGKAAKGTINVATFGKPVVDSEGIARDFDYSAYASLPIEAVIMAAKNLASHINLSMALAAGIDSYLKSQTKQEESMMAILSGEIFSQGLAESMKQADAFAVSWTKTVNDLGIDLETIFAARKAQVEILKANGKWSVVVEESKDDSVS